MGPPLLFTRNWVALRFWPEDYFASRVPWEFWPILVSRQRRERELKAPPRPTTDGSTQVKASLHLERASLALEQNQ